MGDEHKQDNLINSEQRLMPGRSMDVVVAGIGLAAFVLLMFLLSRWLFPVGVSLKDDGADATAGARGTRTSHSLSYSEQTTAANSTVAQLVSVRRNVQIKEHDSLAWTSAEQGLDLADQDSLQTLSYSGATVRLEDSSVLKVGPNSMIVFQASAKDLFTPRRTNSIVMMEGTLSGDFASADGNPLLLEVALPNGLARFIPGDSDAAVAFNINVNPDLSSSVSVHSGKGVISVGGQTLSIEEQHGVTISINGDVIEQGRLPGQPLAVSPQSGSVYQYRNIPPPLVFSWKASSPDDSYRLRLARDAEMTDIVIDERFPMQEFSYQGLQDGTYYWQVSALDGYIEGPAAGPNRLSVVRDEQPPTLELLSSEHLDGQVRVRGRTEPGVRVYVQGEAITTSSGAFETTVEIDPGATLIIVEAVDEAGNVAYESQIINSKFSINGGAR